MGSGAGEAGSILSFAASVFGFSTGWTSYAADYTCYQPVNTSRVKVFVYVWVGLMFPLCFTEMLGVAIGESLQVSQCDAIFVLTHTSYRDDQPPCLRRRLRR